MAPPVVAPAPAPASPSRAAAPKPRANTAPIPGRSRVAAATPADMPAAPPTKPPVNAPNCLPTVLASLSERVKKTRDDSGTPLCNNSFTPSSARSREENTPIAVSICPPVLSLKPENSSLGLEREIGGCRCARRNCHLLGLSTVGFLPCRHRVTPGRYILDRVRTVLVRGCVRALDYSEPAAHPRMDVALDVDHFRGFPTLSDGRSAWRLRLVPWNIAGKRIGFRVD